MGKRIIQQARGKGSMTYRVRKKAFRYKIGYPSGSGEGEVVKIFHSAAHSAPLMKVKLSNEKGESFFLPAFNGAFVGQKIKVDGKAEEGNVVRLKNVPGGTKVYNIELNPGDGGKLVRSAGSSAIVAKKRGKGTFMLMSNKKEVKLHDECRVTVGVVAGDGRILKPFGTAGSKYYKMKAKSKLWPRISAVAVNAIDHPFGSGRGKRIKSKIAKRNSPPGRKVGHLSPRRTGWKK